MSSQPPEGTQPLSEEEEKQKKALIEMLYKVSVDNIAQIKNRQWEVTKWVLAANVVLFIPIAIKGNELPDILLILIFLVSLALLALVLSLFPRTQSSLKYERKELRCYKERYGCPFKQAAGFINREDEEIARERFWFDWLIWAPMLAVASLSSVATIAAALTELCQRGP